MSGSGRFAVLMSLATFGWVVAPGAERGVPAADDKVIILSAVDESGRAVNDLTAADLRAREDGADVEIISAKLSTAPLFVELLVDTTPGIEEFISEVRKAMSAFVRQVRAGNADAQISLMEFGQAAVTTIPFTGDVAELDKGINKLFPKPRSGSVLLEALVEASNQLSRRQSRRRAIVSLNMEPGDEQSREEPKKINDGLKRSGAQLWAISLQKGTNKHPQRDVVLNTLSRQSGGSREFIVSSSAVETYLLKYADILTSQYELTYKRPGNKPGTMVQVGTTRQGVKLHASLYAPE